MSPLDGAVATPERTCLCFPKLGLAKVLEAFKHAKLVPVY